MSNTPTHGRGAVLGAFLAIYGALMQPDVVNAIPGKTGSVLRALSVFSPMVTAGIGSVGAIVAAGSMPPGTPKQKKQ
jgi:hypothetical protein